MISSDFIKDYLERKFKDNYKISSGGREMVVPSIFCKNDYKRHMSINLELGLWQCFKTQSKGNFVQLYSILEGINYRQAYNKFLIDEFFSDEPKKKPSIKSQASNTIEEEMSDFKALQFFGGEQSLTACAARDFIYSRGLSLIGNRFFYAETGKFARRLIIPYFRNDKVFFFQGRDLPSINPYGPSDAKYLNSQAVRMSDILFPFEVDSTGPLFICEGAIDAITLQNLGLNATSSGSCCISKNQLRQLEYYQGRIVIAYDNDMAGMTGARQFDKIRKSLRMVRPQIAVPIEKDWNDTFLKHGKDATMAAALNFKEYDPIWLMLNSEPDA
jgi:hypothetical protein